MAKKITNLQDFRHDIKNDISVIIAFAQLLKLNTSEAKSVEQLTKIEERARIVLSKIESYLSLENQKVKS